MLVKKFEADDMASALQRVKETLGADALILSTKTLRKKGLGVLGKQTVEITAAIESPAMKSPIPSPVPAARSTEPRKPANQQIPGAYRSRIANLADELVDLADLEPAPAAQNNHQQAKDQSALEQELHSLRTQLKSQDVSQLQAEIDQLKGLVQELAAVRQSPPAVETPSLLAATDSGEAKHDSREQTEIRRPAVARPQTLPSGLDDLIEMLEERGIAADAAGTIARFAAGRMNERQRLESQLCREFLTETVAGLVTTSGPLWSKGEAQKRVALVGPTGVGKTTTIAKLAAEAITRAGARVALVTVDTYRIAAVEQLKVYGEIMGLPVEVVLSPEQLQEAFRRHRDKDLILVDTAGRSPRDDARIDELNAFLGEGAQVENCLVLAAPTDERLQQKTLEAFSKLPLSSLIFTKLDETDRCGALINLPTRSNLPLAYLTNGQQVPEDLLAAAPNLVAQLVMETGIDTRRIAV